MNRFFNCVTATPRVELAQLVVRSRETMGSGSIVGLVTNEILDESRLETSCTER
jgi:hypothetical protein